jgi:hypothetical protein
MAKLRPSGASGPPPGQPALGHLSEVPSSVGMSHTLGRGFSGNLQDMAVGCGTQYLPSSLGNLGGRRLAGATLRAERRGSWEPLCHSLQCGKVW